MSRSADGMGRCINCKSKFLIQGNAQKFCNSRCQRRMQYKRLHSSKTHCVVCHIETNSRKYCTKSCQKLYYQLLRRRKAVAYITNKIRGRRHYRKSKNKYIQVRNTNVKKI